MVSSQVTLFVLPASVLINVFLAIAIMNSSSSSSSQDVSALRGTLSNVVQAEIRPVTTAVSSASRQIIHHIDESARPATTSHCPSCPDCHCPVADAHSDRSGDAATSAVGSDLPPQKVQAALEAARIREQYRELPTHDEMVAALPPKCRDLLSEHNIRLQCLNSQWCQDWFLWVNFFIHKKEPGFYVDIGANAPKHLSNTWFFDQCLGWKGICVEPTPGNAHAIQQQRTCEVFNGCVYSREAKLKLLNAGFAGGVVGRVEESTGAHDQLTECVTLEQLLQRHGDVKHVDFISLDVEGNELHALAGFPLEEETGVTIDVVVMENNHGGPNEEHLHQVPYFSRGYAMVGHIQGDNVYVRNKPELLRDKYHLPRATQNWEALNMFASVGRNRSLVERLVLTHPTPDAVWPGKRKEVADQGWEGGQ
eukprot:TRINITY_DN68624_c0_g1_i1.p1 TRINITY_DN68624_c0_g1~~TRINITY_DN68624_c0_g1_i1.p1  ORF type:complete len:422 (+),score=75.74 TRINITY_DN68624_c0_g1_i1:161-1426(+)